MNEHQQDPGPKRPPSLLDQALHAADTLVNEVQQRMPSDLMKQLRAGQRQIDQRIARLQSQLRRSATREEVDRLARRIDELAARLEELARSAGGRATGGRGGRTSRTERPGRASRPAAGGPGGPSSRSKASGTANGPGDRPPRRSTRGGKREEDQGGTPRRSPRNRSRKPPEA